MSQLVVGAVLSAVQLQELTGAVGLSPKVRLSAFGFFLLTGGMVAWRKMHEPSIVTGIQYFDRNNPVPSRPPGPA